MRSTVRSASVTFLLPLLLVAGSAQAEFIFGRLVPEPPESEANNASRDLDVSADGRVLAFSSLATNWLPGANSSNDKVIVVDLAAGSIEEVSRTGAGAPIAGIVPSLSRDGRYVAFANNGGNLDVGVPTSGFQIVRKDRVSGELRLVSSSVGGTAADREARDASISGDGNVVVFRSWATNLGFNNSGGVYQAYAKFLDTGAIVAVSATTNGTLPTTDAVLTPHALSADGRFAAFVSTAADLVAGVPSGIKVYLRDLQTNTTELISRSSNGEAANSQSDWAAVAPGGRFVSFRSFASNLGGSPALNSGVYVRDRVAGTTVPVPKPSLGATPANSCRESAVSDVGTVLMTCVFPAPVASQVFVHIPGATGTPFLTSSDASDVPGNNPSGAAVALDASGLSMAFDSLATNLVPGDTNNANDVFVLIDRDLLDRLFGDGFED